jgi:hypothetical protein
MIVTYGKSGSCIRQNREVTNLYDYRDIFYENQEENGIWADFFPFVTNL